MSATIYSLIKKNKKNNTNLYKIFLINFNQGILWPRGYKTFFMLNSVEYEILNTHKYKKCQEIRLLFGLI